MDTNSDLIQTYPPDLEERLWKAVAEVIERSRKGRMDFCRSVIAEKDDELYLFIEDQKFLLFRLHTHGLWETTKPSKDYTVTMICLSFFEMDRYLKQLEAWIEQSKLKVAIVFREVYQKKVVKKIVGSIYRIEVKKARTKCLFVQGRGGDYFVYLEDQELVVLPPPRSGEKVDMEVVKYLNIDEDAFDKIGQNQTNHLNDVVMIDRILAS